MSVKKIHPKIHFSKLYFRFADKRDIMDLYRWRNDEITRKFSFTDKKIAFKEHLKWFNKSISNPKRVMLIIMDRDGEGKRSRKIGQIRFDKKTGCTEISITIAPNCRHKGYGALAIKEGCLFYSNNFSSSKSIRSIGAKIKKGNTASIQAFENAGFRLLKEHKKYIELRLAKPNRVPAQLRKGEGHR